MTLGIQVYEIKHVVLADRWHEVEPESSAHDAYEFMVGQQPVARGARLLMEAAFVAPGGKHVGSAVA